MKKITTHVAGSFLNLRKRTLIVATLIAMCLVANNVMALDAIEPSQDTDGYYKIESLAHLKWFSENAHLSAHYLKNFKLMNDINADDTQNWPTGYTPPGYTQDICYRGIFDGQNYIIDGLHVLRGTDVSDRYLGLIGYCRSATIKNVGLTNVMIQGPGWMGGIVGHSLFSTIENCFVTGDIMTNSTGNAAGTGGLVGELRGSHVKNSYADVNITILTGGAEQSGGLVGRSVYHTTQSSITNSFFSGEISLTSLRIGGIVGFGAENLKIENCYNTGRISSTWDMIGGIAGEIRTTAGKTASVITNSYSTGVLMVGEGSTQLGGIAGLNTGTAISNCFSDTTVVGATVGGTINNSLKIDTLSFKDIEVFTGWDFTDIWIIGKSSAIEAKEGFFPYLRWQKGAIVNVEKDIPEISVDSGYWYAKGETVSLEADYSLVPSYELEGWYDGLVLVSSSNPYEFMIDEADILLSITSKQSVLSNIDNFTKASLSVYPSLNYGKVYIDNTSSKSVQVEIYSVTGALVQNCHVNGFEKKAITGLKSGIYFVSCSGNTQKVIVH